MEAEGRAGGDLARAIAAEGRAAIPRRHPREPHASAKAARREGGAALARLGDRRGLGSEDQGAASENDATLAQKLGQLQPFYSCIPTRMRGPTCIFWAGLTPFSLKVPYERRAARGQDRHERESVDHRWGGGTAGPGEVPVWSRCCFVRPLIRFTPRLRRYSVPLCLNRQRGRTPGPGPAAGEALLIAEGGGACRAWSSPAPHALAPSNSRARSALAGRAGAARFRPGLLREGHPVIFSRPMLAYTENPYRDRK